MRKPLLHALISAAFILFWSSAARSQCKAEEGEIAASPSQPVVTDSPETIALGVMEVEAGWGRAWPGIGVRHNSVGALFKLGIFCNFEVRNYFGGWQSQSAPGQPTVAGTGDNWISGQYRFVRENHVLPSAAVHYTIKIPMASAQDGLGSGEKDHILALSFGKTLGHTSLNFETKWILQGARGGEFNRYEEYSANFTRSLTRRVAITGEVYGDTQGSPASQGFASTLWYLGYSVNPRLVFDAGVDAGFTHGAPSKRAFAGISYALGNLYRSLKAGGTP